MWQPHSGCRDARSWGDHSEQFSYNPCSCPVLMITFTNILKYTNTDEKHGNILFIFCHLKEVYGRKRSSFGEILCHSINTEGTISKCMVQEKVLPFNENEKQLKVKKIFLKTFIQ